MITHYFFPRLTPGRTDEYQVVYYTTHDQTDKHSARIEGPTFTTSEEAYDYAQRRAEETLRTVRNEPADAHLVVLYLPTPPQALKMASAHDMTPRGAWAVKQ